jgi:hypothetical protein
MQHLLGRCIDNIAEHHSVINSGLSVIDSIEQVASMVDSGLETQKGLETDLSDLRGMHKTFTNMISR